MRVSWPRLLQLPIELVGAICASSGLAAIRRSCPLSRTFLLRCTQSPLRSQRTLPGLDLMKSTTNNTDALTVASALPDISDTPPSLASQYPSAGRRGPLTFRQTPAQLHVSNREISSSCYSRHSALTPPPLPFFTESGSQQASPLQQLPSGITPSLVLPKDTTRDAIDANTLSQKKFAASTGATLNMSLFGNIFICACKSYAFLITGHGAMFAEAVSYHFCLC